MSGNLAQSQEAVKRAGTATKILLVVSITLLLALGGIFAHLTIRQNSLRDSIREDALWAVYQLDRETRTLHQSIDQVLASGEVTPRDTTNLSGRYDILYSRLSLLQTVKYGTLFNNNPTFENKKILAREQIVKLQPMFDKMAGGATVSLQELKSLSPILDELQKNTEDILVSTNAEISATRAETRDNVSQLQGLSAFIVALLTVTIGLLTFNLMRQLKIVRRATEGLEATAREMGAAYSAAEAGNLAKSEFMATMGHEIRTPLNAILGMGELLSLSNLADQDRESVSVILSSGSALLEIINEILDFGKLEHSKMTVETVSFDLSRLLADAVHMMEGRAREEGSRIELVMDEAIPARAYSTDPTLVRRVVLNLLSNAVKFTQAGIIKLRATETAKGLRFEISDTGIGIPPEAQKRLFQPFTQVDGSISRRYGGTGLGLVICKRIVEQLGGEIGVESVLGLGSKFWFEIPAQHQDLAAVSTPKVATADEALPALNILVVEDNKVNRDVMARFLGVLKQNVTMACDGEQGVQTAAAHKFDVILMDMQMPVMDGIAATEKIRATGNTTPIVALTANASDTDRERCLKAGMDRFESKPVTLARLRALLRDYALHHTSTVVAAPQPKLEDQPKLGPQPKPEPQPEPEHPEPPQSDRLNELALVLGEDGVKELVDQFLEDAPALLREVHDAMANHDADKLDRALHSLKGAALNLGFDELAEIAQLYRTKPLDLTNFANVEQAFNRVNQQYQVAA